jgi:hypothetical protein
MVQECNLNKVYTINAHTDKIWSLGNNIPFPQPHLITPSNPTKISPSELKFSLVSFPNIKSKKVPRRSHLSQHQRIKKGQALGLQARFANKASFTPRIGFAPCKDSQVLPNRNHFFLKRNT